MKAVHHSATKRSITLLPDNSNLNLTTITPVPSKTALNWTTFGVIHDPTDNKQRRGRRYME